MHTSAWQWSTWPRWPHHWRFTPTACVPRLGKLLGSKAMIPSGSPNRSATCPTHTVVVYLGAEVGDFQTGEEILFDVPYAVFHPAFFIPLAHIARGNGKAVVGSEVEVLGIEHGGFAERALEDGGFEVVDHDFVRNAPKEVKGVLVAGEEVFHGLGDGELHVHHATVAQDHDKETQLAVG